MKILLILTGSGFAVLSLVWLLTGDPLIGIGFGVLAVYFDQAALSVDDLRGEG